ncbi:hypothetical protein BA190_18110 [Labrys sp. WJW]|nr:hypothetical protein BA190_18110 [Labrys sp. WJW]
MIVRNEQHHLAACLDTLEGALDEIIVVDTGSTDGTIELASRASVKLLHHKWADDFAAARNVALDAVSCDWVLYIDADERLGLPDGGRLADYVDPAAIAAFVRFRPKTGFTRYREWRLFRSEPSIRFVGRIHESMRPSILAAADRHHLPIVQTRVELYHLGYDGEQAQKHARNLPLLQEAVQLTPERVYYWYHLSETLAAIGRTPEAISAAWTGLEWGQRKPALENRPAMSLIFQYLARTELDAGNDALRLIDEGLEFEPADHALAFLRGQALLRAGRAEQALDIALSLGSIDPDGLLDGVLAFDRRIFLDMACELAALACLRLGRRKEAAAHYSRAAALAPDSLAYRVKAAALGACSLP